VFLLAGLVAVLAAISLFLLSSGRQGDDASYKDALFVREPVTLAARIHMLGRLAPSVVYAVETSEGLVLIDSGLEPDAAELIDQLAALGLEESNVCAILLTHVHGDHTLGARFLRELTGAKIYAGQADCEPLRSGGPREAIFSTFPMAGVSIHATPVDVELKGEEELIFGDTRIRVLATPGHTPGSVCYLLEKDHQRALFGGDTISSLLGDLGTYAAYLAPRYRGNARDYLASLRKLRAMPTPDLILPGHPNEEGQPHSPRLSDAQWHELLERGITDMQRLVARFDADGEDFLDGLPKELLRGLHYLGDYQGRAVFVLQSAEHLVLIDAPGDDGLAAFVTERLRAQGIETPTLTAVWLTSGAPDATGGLPSVAQTWSGLVVADSEARAAIAPSLPPTISWRTPAELEKAGWFQVQAISLPGGGPGATAYLLRWLDRDVLLSGSTPSTLGPASLEHLHDTLRGPAGDYREYVDALSQLRNLKPNLWLPAHPTNGQNANLYDDQWLQILRGNLLEVSR